MSYGTTPAPISFGTPDLAEQRWRAGDNTVGPRAVLSAALNGNNKEPQDK